MASLKPNKPSIYDGKRDELSVRTWLYQVQQYLSLIQVGNGQAKRPNQDSICDVIYDKHCCNMVVYFSFTQTAPQTWQDFENMVTQEFVPFDSVQRSRDKPKRLTQRYSVAAYLAEFRNIVLAIPQMTEDEKGDRFCQGLKPQIRLEVMKEGAQTMNDASRVALNVDAALYGAGMFSPTPHRSQPVPAPMDIGNMKQHRRY